MLPIILGVVAVALVLFLILIARQPSEFRVERQAVIEARPEIVFGLVDDFHAWDMWSPWAKRDPKMVATYAGPESGVGAKYAWVGNREVGEGNMTITESVELERITIRLEFTKPFKAVNTSEFRFQKEGDGTRVIWSMTGRNNFVGKAFALLMNMDKLVGGDFEKGLAEMAEAAKSWGSVLRFPPTG